MIKSLATAAALCASFGVAVEHDDPATVNAEVEAVRERMARACIPRRGITMSEETVVIEAQYRLAAELVAWRRLAQADLYADPATQHREAMVARDELRALGIDPCALPTDE